MRRFVKGFKWTVLIAGIWYLTAGATSPPGPRGTDVNAMAADIRLFALGPRHRPGDRLP